MMGGMDEMDARKRYAEILYGRPEDSFDEPVIIRSIEINGEAWVAHETTLPQACSVCRLLEFDCGQHGPIGPTAAAA